MRRASEVPQPGNVLPFPKRRAATSPFDELTAALVLKHYREGTLAPAVIEALLAAVDLEARR